MWVEPSLTGISPHCVRPFPSNTAGKAIYVETSSLFALMQNCPKASFQQFCINAKAPHYCGAEDCFASAVREGFEPPVRCRTPVFEAGSFNHSDISPGERDCKYSNLFAIPNRYRLFALARKARTCSVYSSGCLAYEFAWTAPSATHISL